MKRERKLEEAVPMRNRVQKVDNDKVVSSESDCAQSCGSCSSCACGDGSCGSCSACASCGCDCA